MHLEAIGEKRAIHSFYDGVRQHPEHMHLIAEIKRASPSKGDIKVGVDILEQAKRYEQAGVSAISVLTDPAFFKGSIEDLRKISQVVNLPVLCKDFIIDEKQLIQARNAGATIVLLIVAALSERHLETLYQQALSLNLEILVEVHNLAELKIAEKLGSNLIGINNRDLHSFVVSISVSEELANHQTLSNTVYISESGFYSADDVHRVKENFQAVLVGEALMREDNPTRVAESLMVTRPHSEVIAHES